MAGNFVILPELKLTITKIYGVITDSDIERLQAELVADEKFSSSFDRLTDCRDVTINNVSHKIVKKFGRIIGESKNIKRADLYARDVEKGIFNQYEAYAGTTIGRILVTGSLDDAIEWLGHGEYSESIRKQLSSLYWPT